MIAMMQNALARPLEWGDQVLIDNETSRPHLQVDEVEEVVSPKPEPPTPLPADSIKILVYRSTQETPDETTIFYDNQRISHQVVRNDGAAFHMPQDYFRLLLTYLQLDADVTIDIHIPCFPTIRGIVPHALRSDQVETLVRCAAMFFCMSWNMGCVF
jgi:hypothetical protein